MGQHQGEQQFGRHRAHEGQPGQQGGLDRRQNLGDLDHGENIHPVGDGARDRPDKHHRQQVGDRHQAEPEAGPGHFPGKPHDRGTLRPGAVMRQQITDRERPVIAVAQGGGERGET